MADEEKNNSVEMADVNNSQLSQVVAERREEEKEWEPEPIDREQIDFAWDLIAEFHPLANTPIHVAYPWLQYLCFMDACKPAPAAPAEDAGLEAPLLDKEAKVKTKTGKEIKLKKKPKSKKKQAQIAKVDETDPINRLGFGIVAYRDLLWSLIWMFAALSLITLPYMCMFMNGSGYNQASSWDYEIYSIGNLGYSTVQCAMIPIGVRKITIQCPYGTVGNIIDYGVQPPVNNLTTEVCATTDSNSMCTPNSDEIVATLDSSKGSNITVIPFTKDNLWKNSALTPKNCTQPQSQVFVQYTCEQSDEEMNKKFKIMTVATTCGVFASLVFSLFVMAFGSKQKLHAIEWDMSTVTVADYAVEFTIPPEAYAQWFEDKYCAVDGDRDNGVPIAMSLKRHLTETIEKHLNEDRMREAGIDPGSKKAKSKKLLRLSRFEEVKIADIIFGYVNQKLIAALATRGHAIARNKFDKVRKEDAKIGELIETEFDELTRATAAFIIFEEEEGAAQAVKAAGNDDRRVLGMPVKFKAASEPTDIIWEHRHFYPGFNYKIFCCQDDWHESRVCREIIGYSGVLVCLCLSFFFILYLASLEMKFAQVFPPQNCAAINETYGAALPQYAYFDYVFVTNTEGLPSSGCLQCFCEQQVSEYGYATVVNTTYAGYGDFEPAPICKSYLELSFKSMILGYSFSYILIGFNYVLRTVVIAVVCWIGYSTQTGQLERITTVTFLCQFFNTAFILMLVNADLQEQPITLMFKWGSNGDFNGPFFKTVGNALVSTMIFNMWYPILEWLMYFGMRIGFRMLNRGCFSCNRYKTSSTSIKDYQDIYSGPSYYIHYKYSTVLNVIFVSFMFGFGMPIFFCIGMGSFVILYFIEKSMLYWSYMQPPMYDQRLNDSVLNKMKYAPCFFLAFGYWMASNNQLLSNQFLVGVQNASDTRMTDHVFQDVFTAGGWSCPSWPLLFFFFITIFCCWFGGWLVMPMIEKCCPAVKIVEFEVDQPIDNYFASVDEEDREWSIKEEENARENLKDLKILLDPALEKLKHTAETQGSTMQGVHTYDILANPMYADMFQYVNAAIPNRTDFIIDDDEDEGNDAIQSDIVKAVLNLAFYTQDRAKNFHFDSKRFNAQLQGKEEFTKRVEE